MRWAFTPAELDATTPLVRKLNELSFLWSLCGSRATCNPAPTDTDIDIIALTSDPTSFAALNEFIVESGYYWDQGKSYVGSDGGASDFQSWKNLGNNVNLLLTGSHLFYNRHLAATSVCKRLNVLNKQDRIAIFQAVLYANIYKG